MSLSPGARIGPYEVLGLVGAGGMGEVYRGRDTRLQRFVAIKVITADVAGADVVRRFESEALAASALNHPNILTVYEFGVHEGLHYLVTEFIEGETLRERLRDGPLPIPQALDVAIQMATALEAAHAAGLIHRDIKPENAMIRPDGYVKVLDFGLAKLAPTAKAAAENMTVSLRTTPGIILGTVGYMAPEQVRGQEVDHRADVWSIGVVVHEMIGGRSPFAGETMSDVIASVLERHPPGLSSLGAAVPAELERIVRKALTKNREERYQTIKDLLIDLKRLKHQIDRAAEADHAGTSSASGKRTRPSRAMAGPIGALMVFLVVAGGSAGWWYWGARPQVTSANPTVAIPDRLVHYWLTVQRMRAGEPYQSPFDASPGQIVDTGAKFRFNFLSVEPGFIYVVAEEPNAAGPPKLTSLYPTPSRLEGSAALLPGRVLETGEYRLQEQAGKDYLWIVWSTAPIEELERAKRWVNADDQGQVKDPQQAAEIHRFLTSHSPYATASPDEGTRRMIMRGRRDVLATRAAIERR
jgi:hypothetical protein